MSSISRLFAPKLVESVVGTKRVYQNFWGNKTTIRRSEKIIPTAKSFNDPELYRAMCIALKTQRLGCGDRLKCLLKPQQDIEVVTYEVQGNGNSRIDSMLKSGNVRVIYRQAMPDCDGAPTINIINL